MVRWWQVVGVALAVLAFGAIPAVAQQVENEFYLITPVS
jgi:hypothetical protein